MIGRPAAGIVAAGFLAGPDTEPAEYALKKRQLLPPAIATRGAG